MTNKHFYRRVLSVALPMMIQNGITNFVQMLDNVMVGQVGTIPMSGVAIVNQLMFVFNLCIFGASSGAGIFTAQFHGNICLRCDALQGRSHRNNLLHKIKTHCFTEVDGAGTGDSYAELAITDKFLGFLQQISQCVLRVGMVTAVFAKEDVVLFIQQNKFYGGRADVDTGAVEFHGEIVSLSQRG